MEKANAGNLREEILTDSILSLMGRLSLPAIIAMSINGINAFVDALFVGQYVGQNALAAISLAFPLTMITNGLTSLIGIGSSSLLSRSIGAGDLDKQEKSFGTMLALSLVISALLTVVGLYYATSLIAFMGGRGEILELGVEYYRIMMIGAFFRVFGVAANMLIRAEGKLKEAMFMSTFSAVLNIGLNVVFVVWLGQGVEGAAIATIISMAAFSLMDFWYFFTGKATYPVKINRLYLGSDMLKPILSVGVSAMMLQLMFFIQQAVVFKSLAYYGTERDLAIMGACYRVLVMMIMPIFGFIQAFQPVAGINYGAGIYNRVRKAFNTFSIGSTLTITIVWGLLMLFPRTVMGWMLPDTVFSPHDLNNYYLMMLTLPLHPIFFMGTTLFQSMGDARSAMILQILREIVLYVPMLLILPLFYGVRGIYLAGVPVNVILLFVTIYWVANQFKKLPQPSVEFQTVN